MSRWPKAELDKILDEAQSGAVSWAAHSDVAAQLLRRALYHRMAQRRLHFEIRITGDVLHIAKQAQVARRITR